MRKFALLLLAFCAVLMGSVVVGVDQASAPHTAARPVVQHARPFHGLTIYIHNYAGRYFSNQSIRNDIPAWEHAVNDQFARYWPAPAVRFVLLRRRGTPAGGVEADIVGYGKVTGAIAYHTVVRGEPKIVDYAGVADQYGFSNSVAVTHEIFETLADTAISTLNLGWPADYFYRSHLPESIPANAIWVQEVCDPVEHVTYHLPGRNGEPVRISDFITSNWFNDQLDEPFDWVRAVEQPYTILPGGYAQFLVDGQDVVVTYFRGAGPDANGFLKGQQSHERALR